jgi:hypothetical protein
MWKMTTKSVILCLFVCLALLPSAAFGCACCAEPGAYSIWTGKAETYYLGLLDEMKFGEKATLYQTEAGFDAIKGLSEIEGDFATTSDLDVFGAFAARTWKVTFKSPSGKTGILTLPMPTQMLAYKVDLHDDSNTGLGPVLYKELRFKGSVRNGTGFFRSGIVNPTSFFLVFQGRGNACDNAGDFTHWRLEIDGRRAKYAFFGKMTVEGSDASAAPSSGLTPHP